MASTGNAPSWLFSFVDLAFLLLIAMTQLAAEHPDAPELGEMVVPRIQAEATKSLPGEARELWQLRIHPPEEDTAPFELVHSTGEGRDQRVDLAILRERLVAFKGEGEAKPLLAPHEDSRSQDLLDAVSAIEAEWPSRRRATVAPLFAGR